MCKIIKSENADKKFHNLSSIFLIWNIDDKENFLLGCHHLRARPLRRADLDRCFLHPSATILRNGVLKVLRTCSGQILFKIFTIFSVTYAGRNNLCLCIFWTKYNKHLNLVICHYPYVNVTLFKKLLNQKQINKFFFLQSFIDNAANLLTRGCRHRMTSMVTKRRPNEAKQPTC
jgi:hypothetical protein